MIKIPQFFFRSINTGRNPKTILKHVKRGTERKDTTFSERVGEKKSTTSVQKLV